MPNHPMGPAHPLAMPAPDLADLARAVAIACNADCATSRDDSARARVVRGYRSALRVDPATGEVTYNHRSA